MLLKHEGSISNLYLRDSWRNSSQLSPRGEEVARGREGKREEQSICSSGNMTYRVLKTSKSVTKTHSLWLRHGVGEGWFNIRLAQEAGPDGCEFVSHIREFGFQFRGNEDSVKYLNKGMMQSDF